MAGATRQRKLAASSGQEDPEIAEEQEFNSGGGLEPSSALSGLANGTDDIVVHSDGDDKKKQSENAAGPVDGIDVVGVEQSEEIPKIAPHYHTVDYGDPRDRLAEQFVRVHKLDNNGPEVLKACCPILAGTRIIDEGPFFFVENGDDDLTANSIYSSYLIRSEGERAAFMSLNPGRSEIALSRHIDALLDVYRDLQYKDRSDTEEKRHRKLRCHISDLCMRWRVASRYHASRMYVFGIPSYTANFLLSSRIRHSCTPNCSVQYNPLTQQLTVHAIRDLQPGDYITMTKIRELIWYSPLMARHRNLTDLDAPDASCCSSPQCYEGSVDFREHERIRAQLQAKSKKFTTFLTTLDTDQYMELYARNIEHAFNGDHHTDFKPPRKDDFIHYEGEALDILRLLEWLGCDDLETVKYRQPLFAIIYPQMKGKEQYALAQAKLSLECAERCVGTDHPDYSQLFEAHAKAEHNLQKKQERVAEQRKQEIEKSRSKNTSVITSSDKISSKKKMKQVKQAGKALEVIHTKEEAQAAFAQLKQGVMEHIRD